MNRTKTRLALLVASVCLCTSVWAERVAPTFPDFTTLESGESYYLYNVGTGKFLTRSAVSSTYPGVGTYGAAVTVAQASNGSYTLRFADGTTTYYLYADASTTSSRSSVNNYCYFAIKDSLGGYVIQRSTANTSYYVANEYVGYAEGATNDRIVPNLTEGNIVWQLMETTVAERYFAEHKLYTALEAMNPYNYTIDQYEAIYANPESTNEELTTAAKTLTNALSKTTAFNTPEWTEFPFLIESGAINSSGELYCTFSKGTSSITGTVTVNQNSALVYIPYTSSAYMTLSVFVDGNLVRTLDNYQLDDKARFFDKLSPGTHHIEWRWTNTSSSSYTGYLQEIGVRAIPATIEVSLLEPGSLGTEVLYNVDHLKDVRCLKIKGKMNDDDWAKVDMMTNLFSLDLSEADVTVIPEVQFNFGRFLHEIILPNSLEEIGNNAFQGSYIRTFKFPETLKSIGEYAFSESHIAGNVVFPDSMNLIGKYAFENCDELEQVLLPDSLGSIGTYTFYDCDNLTQVVYPKNLKSIPQYCFYGCNVLETFPLHEGLTSIGAHAFENVYKFNPRLPKTLSSIGGGAFSGCATDSLFVPESLTSWSKYLSSSTNSSYAFRNNDELVYAEFPTSFYQVPLLNIIEGCENLKTLVFKSPTVVSAPANYESYKTTFLESVVAENITIKVPSFLVNSYKLDSYWYNYKIEGFNTADVKDWSIYADLVLNGRERIEGVPNLKLAAYGSIKVNGENPQYIDTLTTHTNLNLDEGLQFARILINNDATTIAGEYTHSYYVKAKTWYFISLPFDFKINEVINDANAKFVIRYYDGAGRAANGASGNWKNYAAEDVVKAGTGFIVQASAAGWMKFRALDNESKQNVVSNEEFIKALDANPSEITSNSGWNLVGNPWQTYFNIHTLNFTAPITVYDVSAKTYTAYSIIDDDYAIRPNEAFFVQCPEGTEYISFPETGRQLTSEITNQSSAPAKRTAAMGGRQLVDVAISAGGLTDKTRVVLNDAALMEYETACDASKFFTMDAGVPQIYTLDSEATEYAINERPVADGNVQLGLMLATSGKHTISMPRNDAKTVVLIDHVAGTTHDLSLGEYTFTADAGTYNGRFTLSISKAPTTAIDEVGAEVATVKCSGNTIYVDGVEGNVAVFSVDGRKVAEAESKGSVAFDNLTVGSYLVRTVNGTSKVTVK